MLNNSVKLAIYSFNRFTGLVMTFKAIKDVVRNAVLNVSCIGQRSQSARVFYTSAQICAVVTDAEWVVCDFKNALILCEE